MRCSRSPGLIAAAATVFFLGAACGDDDPAEPDAAAPDLDASADPDASDEPDGATTADAADPDAAGGWGVPACAGPSIGSVTWTTDEGATLAPAPALAGTTYAFSVAALPAPGHLLAVIDNALWRSTDAGCTWASLGDLGTDFGTLVAAADERAYGFGDNRNVVFTVAGDTLTTHTTDWAVIGLGDPGDAVDHLRVVADDLQIKDSIDGGATWERLGTAAEEAGVIGYRAVFDPANIDHVVVGLSVGGARYTTDGGETWDESTGLGTGGVNVFNLAFSPAQAGLVYAEGLDLTEAGANNRHLWRSTDSGATFTRIVDQSAEVVLYNGNPLFPHPTDPDVLYFTFGSSYQGYGTDLYRWDGSDGGAVTKTHNDAHRAFGLAFAPENPALVYLGLSHENVQ
jgi:hypothetical protein